MSDLERAELPDHEERMKAAEQVAQWYLGYRSWAGLLVNAYINPKDALEVLARDRDEGEL